MKTIQFFIQCLTVRIKKNIFNNSKTDISHECNSLFEMNRNISLEDLKYTEEYLENYNATTRWQTL